MSLDIYSNSNVSENWTQYVPRASLKWFSKRLERSLRLRVLRCNLGNSKGSNIFLSVRSLRLVSSSFSWGCTRGDCMPRGAGNGPNGEGVADVLLSLKHAVVHPGSPTAGYYSTGPSSTAAHHYSPQEYVQNLGPGSVPPVGAHYGAAPAMSVNVSMNMTMNMNMHSG